MSERSTLARFADAVDERIGHRAILEAACDEPVRGGASYAYVFGSGLLFVFALQVVTGITLATVYAPSVTTAWGSVYYIQHEMTLGWLVRGLHHFGSSAMIVLCVLHITQVFLYGAWRRPREANWLTGVVMLLLVLGFGLTGYLLPWDQKGYWATQVATSIVGGTPGGMLLQEIIQGGSQYGNQTLTRFYALHVFVLPITLTLLVWAHLMLFRRHGVTPSPRRAAAELDRRVESFWPYQMLKDVVFAVVILGTLIALALLVGANLEAPADPAGGYDARPEWYFLFQLLKYFEGPLVLLGTMVIPGLAVGFLLLVPWLDRRPGPAGPSRAVTLGMVALLLGAGTLTAVALRADATDEGFQKGRVEASAQAERAVELATLGGIDADGRVVLFEGERLFHDKGCASCHTVEPEDTKGPLLAGFGSVARTDRFLADPDGAEFFGDTVLEGGMEAFEGEAADRLALATWLVSLSGARGLDPDQTRRGREVYADAGCDDCHNAPGGSALDEGWEADATGPELTGYGGFEWTRAVIRDASHPLWYGDAIEVDDVDGAMPAYAADEVTDGEVRLLTLWLMAGAPGAPGPQ